MALTTADMTDEVRQPAPPIVATLVLGLVGFWIVLSISCTISPGIMAPDSWSRLHGWIEERI